MVTVLESNASQQPDRARPHEASAAMEFVVSELRANPGLTFAEVKARAQLNGFELFPILYGRAKKLLGLATRKAPAPSVRNSKPTDGLQPDIVETPPAAAPRAPTRSSPSAPRRGRALGPEMRFAIAALEKDPQATNCEVKAAGTTVGLTVTPQIMVRARARLGLPGQRNAAREAAGFAPLAERPAKPTRAGRPPARAREGANSLDLEALVASIRETETERDRLRDALERIVKIVEELI